MKPYRYLPTVLLGGCLLASTGFAAGKTVRAFILAGQSNMEGKARNSLLDFQSTDPKTAEHYLHLRDGDKWIVRDDVFIKFLGRKGPLTTGFGSSGCTGIELEFGHAMGEHFDDPVVLIKTAWGGHSLSHNFRPPSAGDPGDGKPFGESYKNMMTEFTDMKENYKKHFRELSGADFEIEGFVWFQGFNDKFGDSPGQYEDNMKHFINDVRNELGKPDLPFVICGIGTHGSAPASGTNKTVLDAQMAMNNIDKVKAFPTGELVDKAAEDLFPTWEQNQEEWKKTGSDRPYHYFGSGIWYGRIGATAAKNMIELLADKNESKSVVHKRRTFHNATGTGNFEGTLISYNPKTELVSIRKSNGRMRKFKIQLLSEEDQDYIKASQ